MVQRLPVSVLCVRVVVLAALAATAILMYAADVETRPR
jgi:hypothetical protein